MSATNQGPAGGPVPVVDVLEASEDYRRRVADPAHMDKSYTDLFDYLKTDISLVAGGAITASRSVISSDVHALMGWALAETTGTATASVVLWDGRGVQTEVFAPINLGINESDRDIFMPKGVRCGSGGIFIQVVSGSVKGVVYWR